MKIELILLVLFVTISSCTYDAEIRENEVGVIFDRTTGEIYDEILLTGEHSLGENTGVVFYDVESQKIDFSFDFLFEDVSSGMISFSVNYIPVIDELPNFLREQKTNSLEVYTKGEVRSLVRDLMEKFLKEDLNKGLVFDTIEKSLNQKSEIAAYIKLEEFASGDITYK